MLFIASKEGQLANRLWHTSSVYANAIEYDYSVAHLYFKEYYPYFSESIEINLNKEKFKFCFLNTSFYSRFFFTFFTFFNKVSRRLNIKNLGFLKILRQESYEQDATSYDLNNPEFVKMAQSNSMVLIFGWQFRDSKNINKHKNYLIKLWQPNIKYLNKINSFHNVYKEGCDILIGMHIRKGDYKHFNNGIWYYSDKDYTRWMKEIEAFYCDKKIGFIICTNEKNLKIQVESKCFLEERDAVVDLYLLAKCDLIVGPPSTFSMWASFYGSKPLLRLDSKDMVLNVKNAVIYEDLV